MSIIEIRRNPFRLLPAWLRGHMKELLREKLTRRILLPPELTVDWNLNDRQGALSRAWGFVFSNHIKGAYYEFGVYRGERFRTSYHIYNGFSRWQRDQLEASEPWRRLIADTEKFAYYHHHFYAFDTFQGMPNNEESHIFAEGNYSCSLEDFTELNRSEGIEESAEVRYFVGDFADTKRRIASKQEDLSTAAIVNLDCDLYSATVSALELVGPILVQGSVLLIDDWNCFSAQCDLGQRRAVQEFLK